MVLQTIVVLLSSIFCNFALVMRNSIVAIIILMSVVLFVGCSSVRHVPDGQLLLNSISITSNDTTGSVDKDHMLAYVRQLPNHKFLWSTKFQLGVYNLSGNDTTKWWNR